MAGLAYLKNRPYICKAIQVTDVILALFCGSCNLQIDMAKLNYSLDRWWAVPFREQKQASLAA